MSNSFFSLWRESWQQTKQSIREYRRLLVVSSILILICMLFPTDLVEYQTTPPLQTASHWLAQIVDVPAQEISPVLQQGVDWVENQGRFFATGAQVLLPLITLDKVGAMHLLYVSVTTTVATHAFKRIFNHVYVADTRVGQRPTGGEHNVPSGHSSMAASALGFVCRRYGLWHAYYLLPLVVLTMLTRVLLSAHTLSAVLAGALLGGVIAFVMTTPRKAVSSG